MKIYLIIMETDFVHLIYMLFWRIAVSEHSGWQTTERQGNFMVDYSPLWETMEKKGISPDEVISFHP